MANSLKIRIDGDDSGFKKTLSGIGKVAKKSLSITTKAVGVASAGVTALATAAINSYAEYEQLVGGIDTLFEASSKKVQENAANAYKTAGMSANEYMKTATSFAASLKQSFDDTAEGIDKAADVADMAVSDMSDNVNKMGTDMELIQNAYQGFAKQNYTMLDNLKLGYGGTKTEMERLLADAQKLTGVKYDINNLADVYTAIHVVQTELGITGTTAKEAATTIEGSSKMMKSAWENLATGMADENADMDKLVGDFADSVGAFLNNILPRIEATLDGIGKSLPKLVDKLFPKLTGMITKNLPKLVKSASEMLKSILQGIKKNSKQLANAAVEIVTTLAETIISNLPAILEVGLEIISSIIEGLAEAIPKLIPKAVEAVKLIGETLVNNADKLLDAGLELMIALAEGLAEALPDLLDIAGNLITSIVSGIIESLPKIIEAGGQIVLALAKGIVMSIPNLLNAVGQISENLFTSIGNTLAGIAGCVEETNNKTLEALEKQKAESEERIEILEQERQAWDDLKKTQLEQAAADMAQVVRTEELLEELETLVDANGDVKSGYQDRVNFILGELNSAYGTEYSLIDNQINGYKDLQKEISNTIEAKKWEIAQNAVLPLYEEAYANAIKHRTEEAKKAKAVDDKEAEIESLERQANAIEEVIEKREMSAAERDEYRAKLEEVNAEMDAQKDVLNGLRKEWSIASETVKEDSQIMNDYTEASALAQKGNFEAAAEALSGYTSGFKQELAKLKGDQKAQEEFIQQSYNDAVLALETYWRRCESGEETFNAEFLRKLVQQAKDVEKAAEEIGYNLKGGMIEGINGDTWNVFAAVDTLCSSMIKRAKDYNIIKSPSRLYRDKVGAMITKGVAVGVEKEIPEAEKAMDKLSETMAKAGYEQALEFAKSSDEIWQLKHREVEGLLDAEKEYLAEKARIELENYEKEYREKLANAKDAAEIEEIKQERIKKEAEKGQEAYLNNLEMAAEREREIYEALQEDIENAKEKCVENFRALADSAFDSMEELEDAVSGFESKLRDSTSLFYTYSLPTLEINGESVTPTYAGLADLSKQTEKLEQYADNLDALKARGGVPQGILDEIRGLSVEEGIMYTNALLAADDEEFNRYIQGYERREEAISRISKKEFSKEAEELNREFEEMFGEVPADFWGVGADAAKNFGDAFIESLKTTLADVRGLISAAMSELSPQLGLAVSGGGNRISQVSNSYSPTFNINGPYNQSTREEIKNQNLLTKFIMLRGD